MEGRHFSEFNDYNNALFNIRARSLNNLIYWLSQIVGSICIGLLLDRDSISRRVRAFSGWTILFIVVFIVHIWAFFYQRCVFILLYSLSLNFMEILYRQYTRGSLPPNSKEKFDIFSHGYAGRIMLYICFGLLDAMWQTTAYWLMGAMSNDPAKLAHFTGFCT
jgi:hypothetical protein